MLAYSRNTDHIHEFYIIMELLDRTWSESVLFRNEYFSEKEKAYDALLDRADPAALYVVLPIVSFYKRPSEEQLAKLGIVI